MNKKELTKKLKYTEEKCRNDLVIHTSGPDISILCSDVLEVLKNCIELPKGATNGDMMKAMFPDAEVVEVKYFDGIVSHYQVNFGKINGNQNIVNFKSDWWDAPYKKESE